jgi:hypothetical protein
MMPVLEETINITDLSRDLQEILIKAKNRIYCPVCGFEFTEQNSFDNCASDPQEQEEYYHCFKCEYDSRYEKKEEVPF